MFVRIPVSIWLPLFTCVMLASVPGAQAQSRGAASQRLAQRDRAAVAAVKQFCGEIKRANAGLPAQPRSTRGSKRSSTSSTETDQPTLVLQPGREVADERGEARRKHLARKRAQGKRKTWTKKSAAVEARKLQRLADNAVRNLDRWRAESRRTESSRSRGERLGKARKAANHWRRSIAPFSSSSGGIDSKRVGKKSSETQQALVDQLLGDAGKFSDDWQAASEACEELITEQSKKKTDELDALTSN